MSVSSVVCLTRVNFHSSLGLSSFPPRTVDPTDRHSADVLSITTGRRHEATVPAQFFLRTQLYLPGGNFVKFNFSYPTSALVGVYASRGVPPSHARYDFLRILDGRKPVPGPTAQPGGHRAARSVDVVVSKKTCAI